MTSPKRKAGELQFEQIDFFVPRSGSGTNNGRMVKKTSTSKLVFRIRNNLLK